MEGHIETQRFLLYEDRKKKKKEVECSTKNEQELGNREERGEVRGGRRKREREVTMSWGEDRQQSREPTKKGDGGKIQLNSGKKDFYKMGIFYFKIKVVWISGSMSQMSVKAACVSGFGGH